MRPTLERNKACLVIDYLDELDGSCWRFLHLHVCLHFRRNSAFSGFLAFLETDQVEGGARVEPGQVFHGHVVAANDDLRIPIGVFEQNVQDIDWRPPFARPRIATMTC